MLCNKIAYYSILYQSLPYHTILHYSILFSEVHFCLYYLLTQSHGLTLGSISLWEQELRCRDPLVGGKVVLYTDWHYLHLLLHSKDSATKYTL